jgi:hypothetical protein
MTPDEYAAAYERHLVQRLQAAGPGATVVNPAEKPPCPDCGTATGEHDENCPLVAALDAVCGPGGSDARWFTDHPGAPWFYRDVTPAEFRHDRTWLGQDVKCRVRVTRVAWGRVREYLPCNDPDHELGFTA